jgi:hypothetical protein
MTPKPIIPIALAVILALLLCSTAGAEPVRQPVRAGSFYPSEPRELRDLIDRLAQNARSAQQDVPDRRSLRALILPHAGYPYSGPTAAHAGRVLSENQFKTVLLMGPDHFVGIRSAAVPAVQAFQTPLGQIALHPGAAGRVERGLCHLRRPASAAARARRRRRALLALQKRARLLHRGLRRRRL